MYCYLFYCHYMKCRLHYLIVIFLDYKAIREKYLPLSAQELRKGTSGEEDVMDLQKLNIFNFNQFVNVRV